MAPEFGDASGLIEEARGTLKGKSSTVNENLFQEARLAIVSLFITSTHTDGAFFVYLEEIDENGKVTYVTEGELRALHRRVSSEPNPTKLLVPYHSFLKKDAMSLKPGEVAELRFSLQPISVLIKKGHRLRVAIAGTTKTPLSEFLRRARRRFPCSETDRDSHGLSYR